MKPIITNALDLDFYKLTMGQYAFLHRRGTPVRYSFKCRGNGDGLNLFLPEILWNVLRLSDLVFTPAQIDYLRGFGIFKENYLEFLETLGLDPLKEVTMGSGENGDLEISIEGRWETVIFYETYILSIISEVWTRWKKIPAPMGRAAMRLLEITCDKKPLTFTDFGTRRRHSLAWHSHTLEAFSACGVVDSTSNVMLAEEYSLKPSGTMAHEFLQAFQAFSSVEGFQADALKAWADLYPYEYRIALTDIVGMDAFLREFDYDLARRYRGCRHDSGDPFAWGEKLVRHYEKLGIDPQNKVAVFSDGLNFQLALELRERFEDRIQCVFAIGTRFTNDTEEKPLQIVIKMVECDGMPVAKLSDSIGKGMCEDPMYEKKLREIYGV